LKITFLIRSLDYGGAERQLVTLAKELHRLGHRIIVVVFYPGVALEHELHANGIIVRSLNKQGRWDVTGFIYRLFKFIQVEKPEILHGYLGVPNILTVLCKLIFPETRVVWGVRSSNVDLSQYDWLARISYFAECRMSRFADMIIANSYVGMNYAVKNGFPKEKVVVIPNGIDTLRFQPDPSAGSKVRSEWGITESEKLIGLVGRLDPMKDHATFLKAASLLAQKRGYLRFVCVGDGPREYRSYLHKLSDELGLSEILIWAGELDDMPSVYNALDISCSSSSYGEGFPNVIGESMACGVPCVVTDVGDSARVVDNTGLIVPPNSPEKLAEGLEIMLTKIHEDASSNIDPRARIISEFSSDLLAKKTVNVLEVLVCKER
jgi:glycosyltransferase involved in cell wall biosynthesis